MNEHQVTTSTKRSLDERSPPSPSIVPLSKHLIMETSKEISLTDIWMKLETQRGEAEAKKKRNIRRFVKD
jgi:hypothetical protein